MILLELLVKYVENRSELWKEIQHIYHNEPELLEELKEIDEELYVLFCRWMRSMFSLSGVPNALQFFKYVEIHYLPAGTRKHGFSIDSLPEGAELTY